ncbi:MAG: SDR family NAD(P)-dependent oxidoreductase [Pseudomonadota bacterium]
MAKKILITGATDGIGLRTATALALDGHDVVLHGRNETKLRAAADAVAAQAPSARLDTCVADLSDLSSTAAMARAVSTQHRNLDVLINNAGVFNVEPARAHGLDLRYTVNTISPYLLAKRLSAVLGTTGRVVNVSSAAQSPVDLAALRGDVALHSDFEAYAQSKLALTMWTRTLADEFGEDGPVVVAVNPGSMLGTKMVKDAFDSDGGDVQIGADILVRAALSSEFAASSGLYFDNDAGHFAPPHSDALNGERCARVAEEIEALLTQY